MMGWTPMGKNDTAVWAWHEQDMNLQARQHLQMTGCEPRSADWSMLFN